MHLDRQLQSLSKAVGAMHAARRMGGNAERFVRSVTAATFADARGPNAAALYDALTRAATPIASTTATGWAAELSAQNFMAFLNSGNAPSLLGQLSAACVSVDLGSAVSARIPYDGTNAPRGDWLAEGEEIPVAAGLLKTANIIPYKAGCIGTFSLDLSKHSYAESVIETVLRDGLARLVDGTLISTNAAVPGKSPPGLLYNVTPIATTGNAVGDMRALSAALYATGARSALYIANPRLVLGLASLPNLTATIIENVAVPADKLIAVDPDSTFVYASGPTIDSSREAVLHEADPADPIVDAAGVVSKPVRNLFQTATAATRLLVDCGWSAVPSRVQVITGIVW
jgi:hypothetical protein